jgi:CBS domain-containing protein
VDEVMSVAKCCSPDDAVRDVARVMRDDNIGFVPICDASQKPVGAATDRDLAIRVLAEGKGPNERVAPFITRDTVSCRIGDSVSEAVKLMREHQISRVMVCDEGGKLRGVVSLHDIVAAESGEAAGETLAEVKSDQPAMH